MIVTAVSIGTAARAESMQPAGYLADELRLGTIGYRLATANADRCAQPEMLTGMMLHDISGYDAAARPQVARSYRLTTGFGLLRIVSGSDADQAGLQAGDEIVALNDTDLEDFQPQALTARASPDRTEHFADMLAASLKKGPALLTIRRGGSTLSLIIKGQQGCGGRFVVEADDELNAWTDGRYIAVTSRMMRFAPDDELAFVVAHEMAHNILAHADPHREGNSTARGRAAENEADALAIELLARAGYDLAAPTRFLRRAAKLRWLDLPITHPGASQRIRLVNASVAHIDPTRWAAAPAKAAASSCSDADCGSIGTDQVIAPTFSEPLPSGDTNTSTPGRTALRADEVPI